MAISQTCAAQYAMLTNFIDLQTVLNLQKLLNLRPIKCKVVYKVALSIFNTVYMYTYGMQYICTYMYMLYVHEHIKYTCTCMRNPSHCNINTVTTCTIIMHTYMYVCIFCLDYSSVYTYIINMITPTALEKKEQKK